MRCGFFVPAREAPRRAPPLLPPQPQQQKQPGIFGGRLAFELLKDHPCWKSQLAAIRPFPLTARCAFAWVGCLEGSLSGG